MSHRLAGFALLLSALPLAAQSPSITWKKQTIDPKFRAEGVAVADVNKDGHNDVLNGEFWYEGPDFKKSHEMQKPGDYGDGISGYSHSFAVFTDDFNGDGWLDAVVIDFPGRPCFWLENPQGKEGHWKKHIIWHSACNETPLYKDLLGNGQRVLIMGFQPQGKKIDANEGQMAYFKPNAKDPNALWDMHPISEPSTADNPVAGTRQFSHGLGVGDFNGDGRLDVFTSGTNTKDKMGGWWEQPPKADGKTPWRFHPFKFGEACADMYCADLSGTGKMDILATSAHRFGIWHLKNRGSAEKPEFEQVDLFPKLLSETHAAHFVDIDGDGQKDLVTGKRFWSHGKNEKGSDMPAMIYWFQAKKGADGAVTFTPREIDNDSGIGTQFSVADVNKDGLLDVVVSNKKGVCVVTQVRK